MEKKRAEKLYKEALVFTKFQIFLFKLLEIFSPNYFKRKIFGEKRFLIYLRANKPALIN